MSSVLSVDLVTPGRYGPNTGPDLDSSVEILP